MKFAADPIRTHHINGIRFQCEIVVVASDHVHVELRDDFVEGYGWMIRKIFRPVHAELLAGVPNENQRTLCLWSASKSSGQANESRGSGSVVIGAIVNSIGSPCG